MPLLPPFASFGAIGLVVALAGVHPDSQSSSRIVVEGARVSLELRCQVRSLLECLDLDGDGDGRLDDAELERGRGALERYVLDHYRLYPDLEGALDGVAPLAGRLERLDSTIAEESAFGEPSVTAGFVFEPARAPSTLAVQVDLFREQNPFHRDSASIVWNGEEPAAWLFGESGDTWRFEPAAQRRPGVLASYARLGVHHILSGYDHIAFLVALLVASRRVRSLVAVVTAFTAAHSVTLALAALEVVHVPGRLVELAIALSIAYVALENLLVRRPGGRWLEAFGFGLVHGLGFAGFLGESLVYEPLKIAALVGFNLGVEAGQLAVVLALALVLRFLPGDRREGEESRGWLAPRWTRFAASGSVAALGLFWFSSRAGWI